MESLFVDALGRDISKSTTLERQELWSRLLGRLAHEIRNPLSALHIHVQLLEEDVAQSAPANRSAFARRFEIIHGELSRLESIVKQFVSLSGPTALNVELLDVARLTENVCALLQPEAASRRVTLINECDAVSLRGDSVQLTQALVNLVINAIQSMEGGGTVTVRGRTEPADSRAVIEVRDTGPGVEPSRQTAIFEPFYTTKADGSGLGLWIVQQIVTAHRGTIRVANTEPVGAVFIVELPLSTN